jgi:hypothetical protein
MPLIRGGIEPCVVADDRPSPFFRKGADSRLRLALVSCAVVLHSGVTLNDVLDVAIAGQLGRAVRLPLRQS